MKFRNKKTGEIYDMTSKDCSGSGFCREILCSDCPIIKRRGGLSCRDWVLTHANMAARLMGYEVVEDEDNPCQSCKVAWESISSEKSESCRDSCEKLKEYQKKKTPTRKSVLEAAQRCVCGDRDKKYGSPEDSFRVIAALWEVYLKERCVSPDTDVCILPEDVAALMVLFKVARIATGSYCADSWIDAAGYAACGGEMGGKNNAE